MTARFSPTDILNAHLKGLKNRVYTSPRPKGVPDRGARWILYGLPLSVTGLTMLLDLRIKSPDGLIEVSGILVGAFLVGFTQVALWRERFTARQRDHAASEVHQRDSLDEAVAHLLVAIYGSIALILAVLIGQNFTDEDGALTRFASAPIIGLGTFVVLLLLLIMPKLYAAYDTVNQLDDEMSGSSH